MASDEKKVPKVYSPDISPYSFEGESYFFGTILSFLVAPIRLLSRVMHNIFILPADLQKGYANSLLITSVVLFIIGIVDVIVARKWPLIVSQIPMILFALWLKKQAVRSTELAESKRQVDIDDEAVEAECRKLYDEINSILGSD